MNNNSIVTFAVGLGLAVPLLLLTSTSPVAPTAQGEDKKNKEYKYVGSRKCKKCHRKQYKSWEKTKMAKAYDVLAPNARADVKKKAGLDPAKDYRKDKKCLECHTVGFGKKGGFSLSMDMKTANKKKFLGVGCEMCHGPGGAYLGKGLMDKHYTKADVRKKRLPTLTARGYNPTPGEANCKTCHNKRSPGFKSFDFEKNKKKGTHKHYKKKK